MWSDTCSMFVSAALGSQTEATAVGLNDRLAYRRSRVGLTAQVDRKKPLGRQDRT